MNTEQERAAFEWWASDEGESPRATDRVGECYKLAQIQSYWIAWQARSALQSQDREDGAAWLNKLIDLAVSYGDSRHFEPEADDKREAVCRSAQAFAKLIDHARRIES